MAGLLLFEGRNDLYPVESLLWYRFGPQPLNVKKLSLQVPQTQLSRSTTEKHPRQTFFLDSPPQQKSGLSVLFNEDTLKTFFNNDSYTSIGIVFDADNQPEQRLIDARKVLQLALSGLVFSPPTFDHATHPGTVWVNTSRLSNGSPIRVGCWMMPDNIRAGAIEDFIRPSIPSSGLQLFEFAKKCTKDALDQGAGYKPIHKEKAELSCFLAWQKGPGLPYGTQCDQGVFDRDHECFDPFVKWCSDMFDLVP